MIRIRTAMFFLIICWLAELIAVNNVIADHPHAAPGVTSLTNKSVTYKVAKDQNFVQIRRGKISAIFVNNQAIDHRLLPGHRAGYNGLASLKHDDRETNLFVPFYAGLNFEHIHDGTLAVAKEKFEPRRNPMELRIIDGHTIELYQAPTKNWKLESCGRYQLLKDGTIEYTFECIPRADVFANGYIGLFWASYINRPKDKSIHFLGRRTGSEDNAKVAWINAVSTKHGTNATHPPGGKRRKPTIHPQFPLTLVNHPSAYEYSSPWYYGVSHDFAWVQMFRPRDRIWFAQSPSGGGRGNPAWDFQWFVHDYKVDEAYGFVMRAGYFPFQTRKKLSASIAGHLKQLANQK